MICPTSQQRNIAAMYEDARMEGQQKQNNVDFGRDARSDRMRKLVLTRKKAAESWIGWTVEWTHENSGCDKHAINNGGCFYCCTARLG